jgi:hypothetical protein
MFSTIASILFVPSKAVLKSIDAVKKANFTSGPVVGTSRFNAQHVRSYPPLFRALRRSSAQAADA